MKRFSLILEIMPRNFRASAASLLGLAAGVITCLGSGTAMADAVWPQRAVKIVVPYAAGGSSDTLGRLISVGLTEALKQPFVIENKGGGVA